MTNTGAFFIPEEPVLGSAVILSKPTPAIQLERKENGCARLGLLLQLPRGASLEICGEGFNERTVKVRTNNQYYFVFRQDIEAPRAMAAWTG